VSIDGNQKERRERREQDRKRLEKHYLLLEKEVIQDEEVL